MAALRANIIQNRTRQNNFQFIAAFAFCIPNKKPMMAKGKAKTVWLNFMSDKLRVRTTCQILALAVLCIALTALSGWMLKIYCFCFTRPAQPRSPKG